MNLTDITDIKKQNILSVIAAARTSDGITKKELSERTKLSFATISNITNELIDHGFFVSRKKTGLAVGRTPQSFVINYNRYFVICIDIQRRGVLTITLMNFLDQRIISKTYEIDPMMGAEEVLTYAKNMYVAQLQSELPSDHIIVGLGIAASAIYDIAASKLVVSSIPQFENVDMKTLGQKVFGINTYVDNEANLCAFSVKAREQEADNILYIHASEGLGTGIISGGKLLQGYRGYAGEIAHMPIGDPERVCRGCGQAGCIEPELSIDGILEKYYGKPAIHKTSEWEEFIANVKKGEDKALAIAKQCGVYLGKLIAVLVALLDPSVVYIGGEIVDLKDSISPTMMEEISRRYPDWFGSGIGIIWDSNSWESINIGITEQICSNWIPPTS